MGMLEKLDNKPVIIAPTAEASVPEPAHADMPKASKKKGTPERTLGDLGAIIEAQRIYNPNIPPAPTPPPAVKGPSSTTVDMGVAPASSLQGNWGTPPPKK